MDQAPRFESTYREHSGAVRAFVHRRVVAAEVADDVVADVFAAAWRRVDEMPARPLLWLLGIARGLIANTRRAEARRRALGVRLQATAVPASQAGPEQERFSRPVVLKVSSRAADQALS